MSDITGSDNDEEQTAEIIDDKMSVVDHLHELRKRIIVSIIAVVIGSGICYFYASELVHFITAPAGKLYYMSPGEAFFTYLRVSLFAGFLLALPVVLYQVWSFVLPALSIKERMAILILVPSSVILFFVGLIFSYVLVLPAGLKFFMAFATEDLQPMLSLSEYLSFVIAFLLPFGFIFELPLVIIVLAKLGMIDSKFLLAKNKYVLVLSFVVGAIISPTPDVISQTMVAVPILIMYEISILIVKYVLRK